MSGILVQLAVGLLTVVAAFYAARAGARATQAATDSLDRSARREEWFRRVQWAAGLTLAIDTRSQADGLALLAVLARSDLADADDERLIEALNHNGALDGLTRAWAGRLGAVRFAVADHGGPGTPPARPAPAPHAEPAEKPVVAPAVVTVPVTAADVEAARLRVALDDRLGRTSSPVVTGLAAALRDNDRSTDPATAPTSGSASGGAPPDGGGR